MSHEATATRKLANHQRDALYSARKLYDRACDELKQVTQEVIAAMADPDTGLLDISDKGIHGRHGVNVKAEGEDPDAFEAFYVDSELSAYDDDQDGSAGHEFEGAHNIDTLAFVVLQRYQ